MADGKSCMASILKTHPGAVNIALTLVVALGLGTVTQPYGEAQTFTVLYNFCSQSGCADGEFPPAGVIQDAKGNLYGTTSVGGTSKWGTVFELDSGGTETVLYNFSYINGDGATPLASLIRDAAGNLYGTTSYGGPTSNGVVFKVDASGTETVLHNFAGGTKDGCIPEAGLVRDATGNLYGTTSGCGADGYGTVFKINKSGKKTVMHSFSGAPNDGANPYYGASLITDAKGNLYGTTFQGGAFGQGTVYEVSASGKEKILHSFAGGTADGCLPDGAVTMDKNGNLYGTTELCGSASQGTVWKLSKSGKETVLHNFEGYPADGSNPQAGVILDAKGNLYGTTSQGGANDPGTVFELSSNGTLTLLHSFCSEAGCADGAAPLAGLVRDANGNLYGTAEAGGSGNGGTVWKLAPQ
jgi:uncharacterized repeat protein (TIGR03803 family)